MIYIKRFIWLIAYIIDFILVWFVITPIMGIIYFIKDGNCHHMPDFPYIMLTYLEELKP